MSAPAGPPLSVEDVRNTFAQSGALSLPRAGFLYRTWCVIGFLTAVAAPIVYMALALGLTALTVPG